MTLNFWVVHSLIHINKSDNNNNNTNNKSIQFYTYYSLFLTQTYHMSSEDLEYKAHYDTDKLPTIFVLLCKDDANLPAH